MSRWRAALLLVASCTPAGGAYVEMPVLGEGASSSPFQSVDGWTVELTQAQIGFGPFWACSTRAAAPEHCTEAVLELRETVVIDALSLDMQMLGMARGRRGLASTALWDYGISWLPAQAVPRTLPGAPGGHSMLFAGRAAHPDGRTVDFTCALDLIPEERGAILVRGRDAGEHRVESSDDALIVSLDVTQWWQRMAFEPIWAASQGGSVVLAPESAASRSLSLIVQSSPEPEIDWARPD